MLFSSLSNSKSSIMASSPVPLHLSTCGELIAVQAILAVALQLGLEGTEHRPYNWRAALSRDPHTPHEIDGRVVEFGGHKFVLGGEWRPKTVTRSPWAEHVTRLRSDGAYADHDATADRLKKYQRDDAVRANQWNSWACRRGHPAFNDMPRSAVDDFIQSDAFFNIPVLYASRELYARVLSERTRAFKDSDPNDIDILASSIPYCDLVITDRYMAEARPVADSTWRSTPRFCQRPPTDYVAQQSTWRDPFCVIQSMAITENGPSRS